MLYVKPIKTLSVLIRTQIIAKTAGLNDQHKIHKMWSVHLKAQFILRWTIGIAFTICTNQFLLPKNSREGPKLIPRMALKISLQHIPSGKTGLPFQMSSCSQKFSAGTIQKVVIHLLLSNRIFGKRFCPAGISPRRRNPEEALQQLARILRKVLTVEIYSHTVQSIQKKLNLDLLEQGPRGIGR